MQGHCVLHVDDDPDDAYLFARALRKRCPGIRLLQASSGEEAVERLRSRTPSAFVPEVAILDLKMKGLGGLDVLQWLREQKEYGNLKIVILSGSSLEQDRRKSKALDVAAYITKTADWGEVADQIANILEPPPKP